MVFYVNPNKYDLHMNRIIIILIMITLISCEKLENQKQENQKYDLFPLNVGNEFNYTYNFSLDEYRGGGITHETGNKKWRIMETSFYNDTIEYLFEEIRYNITRTYILVDTTYNSFENDTAYFKVSEDSVSGVTSFTPSTDLYEYLDPIEISFERFADTKRKVISYENSGMPGCYYDWYFNSDSGLVRVTQSYFSNSRTIEYSCNLDSLHIKQ